MFSKRGMVPRLDMVGSSEASKKPSHGMCTFCRSRSNSDMRKSIGRPPSSISISSRMVSAATEPTSREEIIIDIMSW